MSWLDDRTPPMPSVFRPYLNQDCGEDGSCSGLTRAAVTEMSAALGDSGQDRITAFHLLASDAYASYACEAAAGSNDPELMLLQILDAVQATERS